MPTKMMYSFWQLIVFPIYRMWLRKVENIGKIPKNKPFIIAANHASYYDTLLVHSILIPKLNKKIHAFVNSSYWKYPIIKSILDKGESIPVFVKKEKDAEENNKIAFEKALRYLKKGEIIQIFPEGGRSYDGKLRKGYTGIAKLALKAKVPVVPIGIIGSDKILPKGKVLPRFARCDVRIGNKIEFSRYYNKKVNEKLLWDITRNIMSQIAKLTGLEYNY